MGPADKQEASKKGGDREWFGTHSVSEYISLYSSVLVHACYDIRENLFPITCLIIYVLNTVGPYDCI
jgi:hypothetical protein